MSLNNVLPFWVLVLEGIIEKIKVLNDPYELQKLKDILLKNNSIPPMTKEYWSRSIDEKIMRLGFKDDS